MEELCQIGANIRYALKEDSQEADNDRKLFEGVHISNIRYYERKSCQLIIIFIRLAPAEIALREFRAATW